MTAPGPNVKLPEYRPMPNRLSETNSPYLLQHADNPVDWHPWGDEALALAERLDKPILLSIGYAACHWCHVMAHECFEDPEIAAIMNRLFVCIKVDREERPDLDRIYQTAHQILANRPGGWPLTVALTPRGHAPIFAGTYFPPAPRHGMPGFPDLLERIANHYREKRDSMDGHVESFRRALANLNPLINEQDSSIEASIALDQAIESLKQQFDPAHGGFGDAPKFPHPTQLELLLHLASTRGKQSDLARAMLVKTLLCMHRRGLFDQLDGGFFRYSVDREWRIPHFEKMLYDNAQLLGLYADAWHLTGDTEFADAVDRTADWAVSVMQQAHGGFAATLDADSEGEEGRYYVWSETDLRAILNESQYTAVESRFGLYGDPNFEGSWHLNRADDESREDDSAAADHAVELERAIGKMREVRSERTPPALDDKILTSWNGLMIRGLARAARRRGDAALAESARKAADFIHAHLFRNGRLEVSYRDGRSALSGYLDDYAFLAEGLMELLQTGWRQRDFLLLSACCDALLEHFEDRENGGFFYTAHDHESLLYRPKTGADDAIPAGNGAAVRVLYRVGLLTGETRYIEAAERTLGLFADEIRRSPSVFASLLLAAAECHRDSVCVVLRGTLASLSEWTTRLETVRDSSQQIYPIPASAAGLPPGLADKAAITGATTAYVCRGFRCSPPESDLDRLIGTLSASAT